MQYKFFGNPLLQFFGGFCIITFALTVSAAAIWDLHIGLLILSILTALMPMFILWMGFSDKLWYFRVLTFFNKNYRVVELLDYQGKITHNLALRQKNSQKLTTFIYHGTRVGPLVLHENGLVTEPNHKETYIMFWQPYDKQELMMWLLREPLIDFNKINEPPPDHRNVFLYILATYRHAPKPW